MRKSTLLLLLALTLPLCAQAEDKPINTITVHGEATTKIAPDQVTLPVTIREENISLRTAKDRHDEKLRKLLQLATDTKIDKDDIQTSYTSTEPLYDYDHGNTPRLRGYGVQTSIDFTLHNTSDLGGFMNKIIDLGITEIGSVSYSLRDQKKIAIDTLAKAVDNAYEKASRIAAQAKVGLDKAVVIQEGNAEVRPIRPMPMMRAMAVSSDIAQPPAMPAGLTEVHQAVTITYQLK